MPLFGIHGRPEDDPGTRFKVGTDPDTGNHVYFWIRRVPQSVSDQADRMYLGKRRVDKRTGQRYRERTHEQETAHLHYRLGWALRKIDGPLFAPADEEAARLFGKALGKELRVGEPVHMNGDLGADVKRLLFELVPATLGIVIDKLQELHQGLDEDEEEAAENLSSGSSGASTPTTRE